MHASFVHCEYIELWWDFPGWTLTAPNSGLLTVLCIRQTHFLPAVWVARTLSAGTNQVRGERTLYLRGQSFSFKFNGADRVFCGNAVKSQWSSCFLGLSRFHDWRLEIVKRVFLFCFVFVCQLITCDPSHSVLLKTFSTFVLLFECVRTHVNVHKACIQRTAGSWEWNSIIRIGSKSFYLLSHLMGL